MQDGGSVLVWVQGWTSRDKVPAWAEAVNDERGSLASSPAPAQSYLKCGGSS